MLTDILTVVIALLFAVLVGWVARRILDTPVGWPRSIIVGLLIFFTGFPFAQWVIDTTGLLPPSGITEDLTTGVVAIAVVVLSLAWIFALGVAVLVGLEAIFPTRPLPNPIALVRAGIRRRRRTRRYLQILTIASRHGVGWLFTGNAAERELTTREQRAQSMVAAINESGVTFVKLGQVMSTRRDMVPEPYLSALATLQSGATTLPWDAIRTVIETEIGASIDTVFASIDPDPLAAASVAQVHRAQLRDGTPVVVKVQRPAARAQVEADVDIVMRLARRAETRTRFGHDLRLESVAHGFTASLLDELDYRVEASNTEMIRSGLAMIAESDPESVHMDVPRLFPEASGARLITMEFVRGTPLSRARTQLEQMTDADRRALASGFMRTVVEQILIQGVFHADLHPGNAILREDGSLGLIDFGAIGILERSSRQRLTALLLAAAAEDDVAATDALILLVDVPDDVDTAKLNRDIGVVVTAVRYRGAGGGSIFSRMVDVIRENRIALPSDLASAFRSLATLEGCLKAIQPDFDIMREAMAVVPELIEKERSLPRTAMSAQARAVVLADRVAEVPRRLDELLTNVQDGTIGVRLRSFASEADRGFVRAITSQIVSTLVSIAAVIIAVVLIVSDSGPALAAGVTLFDLLGALIGFFGFLGVLRVVRQTFVRPRR